MASKSNKAFKFKAISGALNPSVNELAEKFFSKKAPDDKKSIKTLGNKVEDRKVTQKHNRQKH